MPVRLQELHPSLVHFPIALLPAAVAADLLARLTDSDALAEAGRVLMPVAAASAVVSAAAGLVAQEEVRAEGVAHDLLATHRTLNVALTAIGTAMAAYRVGVRRPGARYLAVGLAGLGALGYSAYLGGKMVYEHGVGVKPADGLRDGDSPELAPGHFGEAARRAVRDVETAIPTAVEEMRAGDLLPAIGRDLENPAALPPRDLGARDEGPGAPESIP
ncbi:DUF2231 domain-containing protein [Roseisolibacter sp. H3M3-2]|uniref:DUF2231 domain-containing protein n=1 Tax=Roseisolibacter sp. H3M3-2 TaxID=3031323 RepID=UPI0023DB0A2A|nr:DUF2231 domain-containing protein [Roseisolibacter sp. H3M3-2]MDF1502915.1 DUF2231 domain-containing protein [Roseisolibacter sp. H3M3-2]